jgi:hypothetical protein
MVGHVLSPAQRAALFNPPSDPGMIQRLYTAPTIWWKYFGDDAPPIVSAMPSS